MVLTCVLFFFSASNSVEELAADGILLALDIFDSNHKRNRSAYLSYSQHIGVRAKAFRLKKKEMCSMRKLTLEIFGASFERIKSASPYWNIKALEILHVLRSSKEEIASICRLEIAGSIPVGKDLLIGKKGIFSSFRAQILERKERVFHCVRDWKAKT
jgi:hypothetical protein